MYWTRAVALEKLNSDKPTLFRQGPKQIAIWRQGEQIFAFDNRCPHEGYPLREGQVNAKCVLTCNWHNWKFDLRSGKSLNGDDKLRTYPLEVRDGDIWLDLTPPDKAQVRADLERQILAALPERQVGRIVRLLARAHYEEIAIESLLAPVFVWASNHLKYGMTHAIGAIPAWFALADQTEDQTLKLSFYAEIFDHLAFDATRYPGFPFPYSDKEQAFNAGDFKRALLAEDEATCVAMISAYFNGGGSFQQLLPLLVDCTVTHYFNFGHSLIYLKKIRALLQRLPETPGLAAVLVHGWIRQNVNATREDLLPEFRGYAKVLAKAQALPNLGEDDGQPVVPRGLNINGAMQWALEAMATYRPRRVLDALIHAAADNMLYFDEHHASAWDVGVKHNISWLDFTHAITMANALGELVDDDPQVWRAGLLQIAMFVGRNAAYVDFEQDVKRWQALADREVTDSIEAIAQHGLGLNIFACHLAKTFVAAEDEAVRAQADTAALLRASVQRLLHAPLLEKNFRRDARQALDLVGKDYVS